MQKMTYAQSSEFTKAMFDLCQQNTDRSKEYIKKHGLTDRVYNPAYLRKSIAVVGGYEAARKLLASESFAQGLAELWNYEMLDISVEALVLSEKWSPFFTEQELQNARAHLEAFGYTV